MPQNFRQKKTEFWELLKRRAISGNSYCFCTFIEQESERSGLSTQKIIWSFSLFFVFSTIFSSTFFHQNFVGVFTSLKSSLLLLWITSDAFKKQLLVWSFLIRHFAKSSPIMCFHRTFCTSLIEICHLKYNNRTFLNLKTTTVFAFCTNYGEVFVSSFETCKTLLVSSKRIFLK